MNNLNEYFDLFDQSRTDVYAMERLLQLFTPDAVIVLNGATRIGFESFMKAFYTNNSDVKHMWEKWEPQPDGSYVSNWAVCGKTVAGKVYALTGIDIAKLDNEGKIKYLENVPTDKNALKTYA
ncbi:nuclear transport factor 2 family protein [Paenibacillus sp. LMG 31461]|uniref:Nuclear transport factor 2 family protein n=1 Tax=Paenibacillus plantarum TaxID=2654975 RepID=A0ABX1XLE4_9BACL|nr:nuclear transport factor 2 family protein [Paenibacillus plantarum]NOU69129.1 nuclear transport factor 2 family protein [Paenibacillus plantarum]